MSGWHQEVGEEEWNKRMDLVWDILGCEDTAENGFYVYQVYQMIRSFSELTCKNGKV